MSATLAARALFVAVACTACVGLFKVNPRKPRLDVDSVPTLLTQSVLVGGQLFVGASLSNGTPGISVHVELVIDDAVVDSYDTTANVY